VSHAVPARAILAFSLALVSGASAALAADAPIPVMLKAHRFEPAEIKVPANQPVILNVTNADNLAEEFDSTALKVEKVIAGGQSGIVRIHPLRPGRYEFMGEYHSATAQGVVIAQ
jgi:heme/copper-type cytochrome/quinol oxidase subunit 2